MPEYYLFIPAKPRRSGGRLTAESLAQVLPEQVPAPTEEGVVPEGEGDVLEGDEHWYILRVNRRVLPTLPIYHECNEKRRKIQQKTNVIRGTLPE